MDAKQLVVLPRMRGPSMIVGMASSAGSLVPLGARSFGRYELLARLATGGMAEIFLARPRDQAAAPGSVLVIKRVLPHLAEDARFVSMFRDEARLAARIEHANVCRVLDMGSVGDTYFLALEYLHGMPLSRVLVRAARSERPLDIRLVAGLMVQCCAGLHHAHELKDADGRALDVVHRDISPPNIFVTADGLVKMLDFGVAKAHGASEKTRTGTVKGKNAYMSPEQVRGQPVDRRSDIFSLGIVLWEALTAKRLFMRDVDFETFRAITEGDVPDVRPPARDPGRAGRGGGAIARARSGRALRHGARAGRRGRRGGGRDRLAGRRARGRRLRPQALRERAARARSAARRDRRQPRVGRRGHPHRRRPAAEDNVAGKPTEPGAIGGRRRARARRSRASRPDRSRAWTGPRPAEINVGPPPGSRAPRPARRRAHHLPLGAAELASRRRSRALRSHDHCRSRRARGHAVGRRAGSRPMPPTRDSQPPDPRAGPAGPLPRRRRLAPDPRGRPARRQRRSGRGRSWSSTPPRAPDRRVPGGAVSDEDDARPRPAGAGARAVSRRDRASSAAQGGEAAAVVFIAGLLGLLVLLWWLLT